MSPKVNSTPREAWSVRNNPLANLDTPTSVGGSLLHLSEEVNRHPYILQNRTTPLPPQDSVAVIRAKARLLGPYRGQASDERHAVGMPGSVGSRIGMLTGDSVVHGFRPTLANGYAVTHDRCL